MKGRGLTWLVVVMAVVVCGCAAGARRVAYNTLGSVQVATTGAYNGYLDLVVQGKVPTNDVPSISRKYDVFQQAWLAAVRVAQWNTNASAVPLAVTEAAGSVTGAIEAVKAGK